MRLQEKNNLEIQLYNTANEIAGNVGNCTFVSLAVTGEPYITFAMYFKEKNEVVHKWTEWVKAYCGFVKFNKSEGKEIYNGQSLTIYWRRKPTIIKHEGKKIFTLAARLLISREMNIVENEDFLQGFLRHIG